MASRKKHSKVDWQHAPDVKERVDLLLKKLDLSFVNSDQIHCIRSENSRSRAYARIWGLSKVWQMTLKENPAYVIEVLAQHFDKLNERQKAEVLIHELAHIPQNFSGSLLPHIRRGKRNFHDRVKNLIALYRKAQ